MKVPEHIPDFLQVHKFVLGLKETLRPLVRKEKCQTLNKAIELAIVLEDGKRFLPRNSQKSSWICNPLNNPSSSSALPSTIEAKGVKRPGQCMLFTLQKGPKERFPLW